MPPQATATPTVNTQPVTVASATNSNPTQLFNTLDSNHKGYLIQSDVAPYSFLAGNFQKCDANSDGRLSADEVAGCLRNMPLGEQ